MNVAKTIAPSVSSSWAAVYLFVAALLSMKIHEVQGQFTSGISCPTKITPLGVPSDVSQLWGTWFTIAAPISVTNTSLVCPQLVFQPDNPSNISTDLAYLASFNIKYPTGTNQGAEGTLTAVNPTKNDPAYILKLFGISADFWFITTDGGDTSGNNPTALVTLSCDKATKKDAQLFFLSRQPYFMNPVTYNSLMSKTKSAINNFDDFNLIPLTQVNGWCYYPYSPIVISGDDDNGNKNSNTTTTTTSNDDDSYARQSLIASSIAAAFAIVIFLILLFYGGSMIACARSASMKSSSEPRETSIAMSTMHNKA